MTQRDWQKDMDTCIEEQEREDVGTQSRWMGAMGPTIASYWLQEAKVYKQSYEGTLTAWEAEKARADEAESNRDKAYNMIGHKSQEIAELREALAAAEAREQRLKEAAEKVSEIYESEYTDEEAVNAINDMFKDLLSTLYPDTPAPTNEEE